MNSIFHAFNMKYKTIGELAPTLKSLGFTHVQFPPIQECRVLSEMDDSLLRAQLKNCRTHLTSFSNQVLTANHKTSLYMSHNFDYLLKQRVYYINQPTFRLLHTYLLNGVKLENLYTHAFAEIVSYRSPGICAIAVLDAMIHGSKSIWAPFLRAFDIVLEGIDHASNDFSSLIYEVESKYKILAKLISESKKAGIHSHPDLNEKKQLGLRLLYLKDKQKKYEKSQYLQSLLPTTKALRSQLMMLTHLPMPNVTKKINIEKFFSYVFLLEILCFPHWWMIYQPLKFSIGDTFLGLQKEIHEAILLCKHSGIEVITDVVINNLAAVAGEHDVWSKYADSYANTLADVQDLDQLNEPVKTLKALLKYALDTDDLSCVTPPIACGGKQEPTQCWMSQALPQFNQNHPAVIAAQAKFLNELLEAGVDGLRIDAAVHLPPQDCDRILKPFSGLSYIEYVGGSESWRKYPSNMYDHIRMEDFAIGEGLYMSVFGPHSELHKAVNYGGSLVRHHNLDSVVMVINHDQVMGSIPSRIFTDLPSQYSYELSVAYLLQRIYGNVLVMPHDISLEFVRSALKLRQRMKTEGIVREYVELSEDKLELYSYKFNKEEMCLFVAIFNLRDHTIETKYGPVDSHKFTWFALPATTASVLRKNYNRRSIRWMSNLYNAKAKSFTRKHKK